MRCLVCNHKEWENVDEFRDLPKHKGEPVGMAICQKCGFVSYPDKYKTEDQIREYYKKEYRGGAPNYGNFATGQKKLHYHRQFLAPLFEEWRQAGKDKPVFVDVGAAIGMVVNWFKREFPEADAMGVELTETYKNTAFHEFGVELTDDIDSSKKYDLIMSYKVAEHMMDADLKIREYAKLLSDGGKLYISVPTWFNALENPGVGGFDLEYYYHPDHINVWTRIHFEEVLRKSGFKVLRTDRLMYGDTYLCERDDSVMEAEPTYEDPKEIKAAMRRIKAAFEFMQAGKPKEALEQWGNFPAAWGFYYEKHRQELHDKHQGNGQEIAEVFCKEMLGACGDIFATRQIAADILMRYGHYDQAIEVLERVLADDDSNIKALFGLSNCFRMMAEQDPKPENKLKLALTARNICRKIALIDERAKPEALSQALRDQANISPRQVRSLN